MPLIITVTLKTKYEYAFMIAASIIRLLNAIEQVMYVWWKEV
jgi:hypothetical protein